VNLIAKLETEIDKCKKARGPQMKKMKERQAVLAPRVEHARSVKAKLAEIHALVSKGVLEGSIVRSLRGCLNDFMAVTED
jgi:hypothetical protein